MFEDNRTLMIVLVIGILALVFVWYSNRQNKEMFSDSNELESYYTGGTTKGVEDYLVDNLTCSPDCCGGQYPAPYDGLSAQELEHNISLQGVETPFVRTNMTCANGIGGVGCPCIKKNVYKYLVNRGENALTGQESCGRGIEPTLLIRNPPSNASLGNFAGSGPYEVKPRDSDMLSYAEVIQSKKSMFVDSPLMNDKYYERPMQNLDNVKQVSPPPTY